MHEKMVRAFWYVMIHANVDRDLGDLNDPRSKRCFDPRARKQFVNISRKEYIDDAHFKRACALCYQMIKPKYEFDLMQQALDRQWLEEEEELRRDEERIRDLRRRTLAQPDFPPMHPAIQGHFEDMERWLFEGGTQPSWNGGDNEHVRRWGSPFTSDIVLL